MMRSGTWSTATAVLHRAQSTVRVSWAEEPGEFRWVLDRSGDDLSVQVLSFDSLWGPDPDEKGKVLLPSICFLTAFQPRDCVRRRAVLDGWGEAEYRAKWIEHYFPAAAW